MHLNKTTMVHAMVQILSWTQFVKLVHLDGSMSKEINRRISSGRLAMIKLEKIMKDRDVTATTKAK